MEDSMTKRHEDPLIVGRNPFGGIEKVIDRVSDRRVRLRYPTGKELGHEFSEEIEVVEDSRGTRIACGEVGGYGRGHGEGSGKAGWWGFELPKKADSDSLDPIPHTGFSRLRQEEHRLEDG
jgi:hypothetical protein